MLNKQTVITDERTICNAIHKAQSRISDCKISKVHIQSFLSMHLMDHYISHHSFVYINLRDKYTIRVVSYFPHYLFYYQISKMARIGC